MGLQSMSDEAYNSIKSLESARDKIIDGASLYFEVDSQSGTLNSSDELVEVFNLVIDIKTQKYKELVATIQKVHKLASELDIEVC